MFRMALKIGSVAILALSVTGCQMCCHPYDKSGPVFCCDGSCCSRAGSIFAGCPGPSGGTAVNNPADRRQASPSPVEAKKQRPPAAYGMTGGRANPPSQASLRMKKQRPPFSYVMTDSREKPPVPTHAEAATPQNAAAYTMAGNRADGPLLGPAQPGDVAGSERIVSVTERVVGPSADSPPAAAEASLAAAKPLPPSGWTARRPTTELMR